MDVAVLNHCEVFKIVFIFNALSFTFPTQILNLAQFPKVYLQ